ncbi:hypothetical protein PPL_04282 [Heterostelium album PN500]|uniref:Glycerophosphodiester phosphodiesterase n=1 Tax=Heterostelium pallidum (strain ATCC 26659 / Pp 5 / PN500) TaxID=670386 RepID=D3B748_HETP5|nr:hypothetical protein PPL_04282 [Heterostelium album PN500]EFA82591.1 hypothetical protein PPL_04282 [Heterostelium album PN500]|eukprot:XP_020434708.1 hypothetical protein PPL_04282 [Heterostelium album PN500]
MLSLPYTLKTIKSQHVLLYCYIYSTLLTTITSFKYIVKNDWHTMVLVVWVKRRSIRVICEDRPFFMHMHQQQQRVYLFLNQTSCFSLRVIHSTTTFNTTMKFSKYLNTMTVWNHNYIPYQRLKRKLRAMYSPQLPALSLSDPNSNAMITPPPSPMVGYDEFLVLIENEINKIDSFIREKENDLYQRYQYLVSRFRGVDFASPFSSFLYLVQMPTTAATTTATPATIAGYKEINSMLAYQKAFEDIIKQLADLDQYAKINVWAVQKLMNTYAKKKVKNIDAFFSSKVDSTELGQCSQLKKITLEIEREFQTMTQSGLNFLNNPYINLLSPKQKELSQTVTQLCQLVISNDVNSLNKCISDIKVLMEELRLAEDQPMWKETVHSCIHKASYLGHLDVGKFLFEKFGSIININFIDEIDKQFIHIAAGRGHPEFVEFLIEKGASIHCEDYLKRTPLHIAAQNYHINTVKLLLSKSARVDTMDREGCTPLYLASRQPNDNAAVIKVLLEANSPITPGPYGRHLIHEAAIQGSVNNMTVLLENPQISVNATDSFGRTPLFECAKRGFTEVISLLLAKDALVDLTDEDKRTPIHMAAGNGHRKIIEILVEQLNKDKSTREISKIINSQDDDGWTPLHESAYFNFLECTKILLENKANPFIQDKEEWSPIVHSLYRGNIQTAITIMEYCKANEIVDTTYSSTPNLKDSKGIPQSPKIELNRSTSEIDLRASTSGSSTPKINPANASTILSKKIPKSSISNVTFKIIATVKPGYRVGIIGNRKALGKWNPAHALFLNLAESINGASGESVWVGKASLPTNVQVEYKYIICEESRLEMWEALPENRKFSPEEEEELINDGVFGAISEEHLNSAPTHGDLSMDPSLPSLSQSQLVVPLPSTQQKTLFVEKGWLVNDNQIRIRFGETSPVDPQRKLIQPIKMYNDAEIGRIVVSVRNNNNENLQGTSPTQISHPCTKDQTITFQTPQLNNFQTVQFDMYRMGMSHVLIGRAVLLASDLLNTKPAKITVPIMNSTLTTIGELTVFPLIVTPFTHPNISQVLSNTYWKSTLLIGHRGGGAENARNVGRYKRTHIKENTILSFVTAASLGAQYIEFDVQLSRDNAPIIYHDFEINIGGIKVPVNKVPLDQISNIQPKRRPLASPHSRSRSMQDLLSNEDQNPLSLSSGSVPPSSSQQPSTTISDSMTTLEETFKRVPIETGFNIEIKYPCQETEAKQRLNSVDRNAYVDIILGVVFEHAGDRQVMFSSFDPDICILCSLKQPRYPVFFLNNAGFSQHSDPRTNSISEAIRFSKSAHLLGIVTNSRILTEGTPIIREVKMAGLMLCSWGQENNDPALVDLQETLGVDAVIVDHVAYISKHYNK